MAVVLLWNQEKLHKYARCFFMEIHQSNKENALGVNFNFASLNI